MKRMFQLTLVVALAGAMSAALVAAPATTTSTVTVSATVSATAKLVLGAATVSFPDADPDVSPLLSAPAITVDAKGKTSTSGNITLTVVASDDLKSGSDVIGISNLTWTATGTGYSAGTMSKASGQTLGSWTGSGAFSGTQTYKLANSWSYATGSYSTTLTYTLTAP